MFVTTNTDVSCRHSSLTSCSSLSCIRRIVSCIGCFKLCVWYCAE